MPKAEINISNLENKLEDRLLNIRKFGFMADYIAGEFLKYFGQPIEVKRTYEQDEALLIFLVNKYIDNPTGIFTRFVRKKPCASTY